MAYSFLVILLLNACACCAFLVNSSSSGLTSYEFRLLSEYILDEKQLRHQLEGSLASLQQELQNTKTQFNQQLNDTKEELKAVKSILAQHSKTSTTLQNSLNKETANRQQLQQELVDLNAEINKTSTKHVIIFNAQKVANTTPASNETVIFKTVLYNIGNAYNHSSGIFTAPYNGSYIFNVQACATPNKQARYHLMLNSADKQILSLQRYNTLYSTTSNSVPVHLISGQKVWVMQSFASAELFDDNDCNNQFSGVFIG